MVVFKYAERVRTPQQKLLAFAIMCQHLASGPTGKDVWLTCVEKKVIFNHYHSKLFFWQQRCFIQKMLDIYNYKIIYMACLTNPFTKNVQSPNRCVFFFLCLLKSNTYKYQAHTFSKEKPTSCSIYTRVENF